MRLVARWRRLWRRPTTPAVSPEPRQPRYIDIRITHSLFERVLTHVEDFSRGEEAGFLICSLSRLEEGDVLLVGEWMPIPGEAITRGGGNSSVLSWSAEFNSAVLAHAMGSTPRPYLSIPTDHGILASHQMTGAKSGLSSERSAGSLSRCPRAHSSLGVGTRLAPSG